MRQTDRQIDGRTSDSYQKVKDRSAGPNELTEACSRDVGLRMYLCAVLQTHALKNLLRILHGHCQQRCILETAVRTAQLNGKILVGLLLGLSATPTGALRSPYAFTLMVDRRFTVISIVLGRIVCIAQMPQLLQTSASHIPWYLCVYVCLCWLLGTPVSPAKTAEPIGEPKSERQIGKSKWTNWSSRDVGLRVYLCEVLQVHVLKTLRSPSFLLPFSVTLNIIGPWYCAKSTRTPLHCVNR